MFLFKIISQLLLKKIAFLSRNYFPFKPRRIYGPCVWHTKQKVNIWQSKICIERLTFPLSYLYIGFTFHTPWLHPSYPQGYIGFYQPGSQIEMSATESLCRWRKLLVVTRENNAWNKRWHYLLSWWFFPTVKKISARLNQLHGLSRMLIMLYAMPEWWKSALITEEKPKILSG